MTLITKGDAVLYFTCKDMPRGPLNAMQYTKLPLQASVSHVHTPRLIDVEVIDDAGKVHRVRFVNLLHKGDPNPLSLAGHCELPQDQISPGADKQ